MHKTSLFEFHLHYFYTINDHNLPHAVIRRHGF